MWWAMWCAAVLVGSSVAMVAPAPDSLNMDLVQMDSSVPDDENVYALQPMGDRYAAAAPWLYLLSDMPHDSQVLAKVTTEANEARSPLKETSAYAERSNRERRSFTVNPPVEHLQRNAYLYFLDRVAQENRHILNRIGKRGYQWSAVPDKYY